MKGKKTGFVYVRAKSTMMWYFPLRRYFDFSRPIIRKKRVLHEGKKKKNKNLVLVVHIYTMDIGFENESNGGDEERSEGKRTTQSFHKKWRMKRRGGKEGIRRTTCL
jgi:hypothetical protein